MSNKKRVTVLLTDNQLEDLTKIMNEDNATNYSFFIALLITKERQRREGKLTNEKRPVGRPRKEVDDPDLLYPAPPETKMTAPYTKAELEGYYEYHGLPMPPLPPPLTPEQIRAIT